MKKRIEKLRQEVEEKRKLEQQKKEEEEQLEKQQQKTKAVEDIHTKEEKFNKQFEVSKRLLQEVYNVTCTYLIFFSKKKN